MVDKVIATPAALALIELLAAKHGPLLFHQSGGCCDNTAPNCFRQGEIGIGQAELLLGEVGGQPFYIDQHQYEFSRNTQLIIDAVDGYGATFSLEGPEGKAFINRYRLFTDDELTELQLAPGNTHAQP